MEKKSIRKKSLLLISMGLLLISTGLKVVEAYSKETIYEMLDLYDSYLTYRRFFSKEFNFSVDYDFPSLLFSYYYTNNLDLYEVNNVIFFYIKNRDYYLEKMAMNGLFFPFDDDDSMPKFFNNRYSEIYQYFIPVLVNDYKVKNENKKRIK